MTANRVDVKKLLLGKWTAVQPQGREKHFLVTRLILPEPPETRLQWIEIEAVHSGSSRRIAWRELKDAGLWRRGWV